MGRPHPGRLYDLCAMAMMGVLLVVSKEALAGLPNFEAVSLLIILFTLSFGARALGAVGVFLGLEGLLYGFGSWWVMYLYVWPLLWGLAMLLGRALPLRLSRGWQWALVSGAYGLAFGTLCSLAYLPVGGVKMAFAWIVSGLPFDAAHGVGNFVLMLVLYYPLHRALESLARLRKHIHT
jgi:energy-coupling factor transport system substrate-specific component